jgi:uncharacterized protein
LHYAARRDHTGVVDLLLANKADVHAKDNAYSFRSGSFSYFQPGGSTPLHWATDEGQKGVAELLLDSKVEVNAKNNEGATALHVAARDDRNEDVVELLLAKDAEVNAKNNQGLTPLRVVEQRAWVPKEMVELLRQRGGHE